MSSTISSRFIVVTKNRSQKFQDFNKKFQSENLRNSDNRKLNNYISQSSKSRIKRTFLNCYDAIQTANNNTFAKPHKPQPLCGAVCTASQMQSVVCHFATLTTNNLDETTAKKFLNTFLTIQRKKSINLYLWVCEISKGGAVHFHILFLSTTTEQMEKMAVDWKQTTGNYYKQAFSFTPCNKLQVEKSLNYILKDETKENLTGRKWGQSRLLSKFKPTTPEQMGISEEEIIDNSEIKYKADHFAILKPNRTLRKKIISFYRSILSSVPTIQTKSFLKFDSA